MVKTSLIIYNKNKPQITSMKFISMRITSLLLASLVACLFVSTARAALPDYMLKKMGTISGQVFIDEKPASFAMLSFFLKKKGPPPLDDGMRRVPELLSRTNADGMFKTRLLAGEYYLGILKRPPNRGPGPPREGEQYYFAGSSNGELTVIAVKAQDDAEIGRINGSLPDSFKSVAEFFTVKGVVRSENGTPYRGVVVLGKSRLNIPRPEFISKRTGPDGAYQLRLPASKPYYLVARETIASARPRPGSYIGTYGIESKTGLATPSIFSAGSPPPGVMSQENGSRALVVSGGAGESVSGIDIFMYKVPNPEEIKASVQGTKDSPRFDKGAALNNIFFAYNSHHLNKRSFKELDQWASFLNGRLDLTIELHGHTDSKGSAEYNLHLSQDRAQAVANYLVAKGIAPKRLIVKGFGSGQPVADNDSSEGRSKNRRVEVKFVESTK
jgi:outer membrane protein OmpA-like peptidoglycan-associated protein